MEIYTWPTIQQKTLPKHSAKKLKRESFLQQNEHWHSVAFASKNVSTSAAGCRVLCSFHCFPLYFVVEDVRGITKVAPSIHPNLHPHTKFTPIPARALHPHPHPSHVLGWPEPYICTVYGRIFGDFPAKNTVHMHHIYVRFYIYI
jgi:hypothetical protein